MNYYTLYSEQDFDQWDNFLKDSSKGHYGQLSTYLKSFIVYGADYKIIVAKDLNNEIIAGIGLVVFGKGPLKIVSLPLGPIIKDQHEEIMHDILNQGILYAKSIKAFLFQFQIPYSLNDKHPYMYEKISLPEVPLQKGFPFKVGSISNQLFLVDINIQPTHDTWEESMLMSFNANTRRDIRRSERNNLELREAKSVEDIKKAYELMIENGLTQGYATRSWEEFSPTFLKQVKKEQAVFLTVFKNDILLGVHYGVITGQSYNYIMGGTHRLKKDYLVGHFLHWNVIKKAKSLGLSTYDFTSTGSPGVYKFKIGFKPKQYFFDSPYYYVLSSFKFKIFYKIFPVIKNNKKILANMISFFYTKKR